MGSFPKSETTWKLRVELVVSAAHWLLREEEENTSLRESFPIWYITYWILSSNFWPRLEVHMEKWTGSKLGKEYIKAVYCHPAYLTYMRRNAGLDEAQAGIKIAGRSINNLRYAVTPLLWQKVKKN